MKRASEMTFAEIEAIVKLSFYFIDCFVISFRDGRQFFRIFFYI
jgi:hypothetical protein